MNIKFTIPLRKFKKNLLLIIVVDILIISASFYAAHLVRFDFRIPEAFSKSFFKLLPGILLVKIACFYFFDLYRGMWRYTSLADLMNIIKASSISTLLITFFILLRYGFVGFSRSIFIIDWCFTVIVISGFRMSVRVYFLHFSEKGSIVSIVNKVRKRLRRKSVDRKKLLIVGAGNCAKFL